MKYYLENFTPVIHLNKKYTVQKTKKTIYLCENGFYEIKNKIINKFKIKSIPSHEILENYVNGHRLVPAGYKVEYVGKQNFIPNIHKKIIFDKLVYRLHEKSKTKLIIFKQKDKIIDCFFESQDEATNTPLKEDIVSLVSHFK